MTSRGASGGSTRRPDHDGHPFLVVLDDEAQRVAPLLRRRPMAGGYAGMGLAHVVGQTNLLE